MSKASSWHESLQADVRALAVGWSVKERKGKVFLRVRQSDQPEVSVTLPFEWIQSSKGDVYTRIRNIFKLVTGDGYTLKQAALVAEAFRMVRDGVMSVEDVDACVKHGLGLRWAFMGPFETCDLNAPGGIPDYALRYGPLLSQLTEEMPPYDFDAPTVAEVNRQRTEIQEMFSLQAQREQAMLNMNQIPQQAPAPQQMPPMPPQMM
jgi:hypothetical protein